MSLRKSSVAAAGLLLALGGAVTAQSLFVTSAQAAAVGGVPAVFRPSEIGRLDVGQAGTLRHALRAESFDVLVGDADQDGHYADAPAAIDALAVPSGPVGNDVFGLLMSFTTSTAFADGTTVLDGDVVALQPNGGVLVAYSESLFQGITGTTTIDVDAFHVLPDGSLLFSFDADETTASAALAAQNGGVALIDETVVFRYIPGAAEATIHFTRQQMLGFVNNALGTSLTSIVDTVGLADDPTAPGAILFTTASTAATLEGKVFTTNGGGQVATFGGLPLDHSAFGFDQAQILGGLAVNFGSAPKLDLVPASPYTAGGATDAVYVVDGATPGQAIVLGAAASHYPAPATSWFGTLGTYGYVWLDVDDAFLSVSLGHPAFTSVAGPAGRAVFTFPMANVPTGIRVTLQAFDLAGTQSSLPLAVEI